MSEPRDRVLTWLAELLAESVGRWYRDSIGSTAAIQPPLLSRQQLWRRLLIVTEKAYSK